MIPNPLMSWKELSISNTQLKLDIVDTAKVFRNILRCILIVFVVLKQIWKQIVR